MCPVSVMATREQATIYYLTLTKPKLQGWLKTWRYKRLEKPVLVTERTWHISEINRIITCKLYTGGANALVPKSLAAQTRTQVVRP